MSVNRKRLLVTTTTLPRFDGDSEPRFVLDLARNMQDQFDITILAPSFPGARLKESMSGMEVVRYRYAPAQSWERLAYPGGIMPRLRATPLQWAFVPGLLIGQARALRRLTRSGQFDIIHAHWTIPQGLLAATTLWSRSIPFVATAHGGDVYAFGRPPFTPLLRFVMRRAAAVTAVSDELLQLLSRIEKNAVNKIHHIPMGVDYRHFSTAAARAERPPDMPQGPVIIFVGRLTEKKGVQVLIDALSLGRQGLESANLVIVGDGPLRPALEERARTWGLSGRVRFIGPRNHASLPAYLSAADVFALPSVEASDGDKDGLPVVLMEAAACGTPAVASSIGGIPQFLKDGRNGLLVPPGDAHALAAALARLLNENDTRKAFSTQASATAQAFDWSVISGRYAELLKASLNTARPDRN